MIVRSLSTGLILVVLFVSPLRGAGDAESDVVGARYFPDGRSVTLVRTRLKTVPEEVSHIGTLGNPIVRCDRYDFHIISVDAKVDTIIRSLFCYDTQSGSRIQERRRVTLLDVSLTTDTYTAVYNYGGITSADVIRLDGKDIPGIQKASRVAVWPLNSNPEGFGINSSSAKIFGSFREHNLRIVVNKRDYAHDELITFTPAKSSHGYVWTALPSLGIADYGPEPTTAFEKELNDGGRLAAYSTYLGKSPFGKDPARLYTLYWLRRDPVTPLPIWSVLVSVDAVPLGVPPVEINDAVMEGETLIMVYREYKSFYGVIAHNEGGGANTVSVKQQLDWGGNLHMTPPCAYAKITGSLYKGTLEVAIYGVGTMPKWASRYKVESLDRIYKFIEITNLSQYGSPPP